MNCCPNCGFAEAVSKVEAWDALAKVPPKAEKELTHLRSVYGAAHDLLQGVGIEPSEHIITQTVPVALIDALRKAIKTQ